jgi:hypothetical protein
MHQQIATITAIVKLTNAGGHTSMATEAMARTTASVRFWAG